jgi:DNA-directed RNA polymerase alpha subunit
MSSEPTPIPLDRLAAPARRALEAAGYTTLEQLAEVREREIADLHGMGANALEKLRRILAEHGLSFAESS